MACFPTRRSRPEPDPFDVDDLALDFLEADLAADILEDA